MKVEIGQEYEALITSDPFFKPMYKIVIEDVKANEEGIVWVLYHFLHKDENGKFARGSESYSMKQERLENLYKLCSKESKENLIKKKEIKNAIDLLEV